MLKSNRIKLRAIEEGDLPLIASWRSDPQVYEYFYEFLPISSRQQKNWFEKQLQDSSEINLVVSNLSGIAIGTVSIYHIDRRNRKAEWGRLIIGDPAARSGGIGAEIEALILQYSFEHLNLHKLYCEVLVENEKVISLHKKFGFREEGILRDHAFKAGKYADAIILAMLDSEYFVQRTEGRLATMLARMHDSSDSHGAAQ
ncbi:UDP-4-amino-4,6-dideoxy-N-acetyl-beta-L-altrosamine N-acetyltransferase [Paraburkholderia kirstenboschensis]|uniref:UDP-4-amino-4, 6-dideoxy-N-acetyl-beta-L-altrosamine N-acetyltransferase n=1 Tax=Paraburkholderia kirstenboschensis TaxID=1245436 RepID=A0ABZ0ER09_9BURK|nr:UDP-4-amino-4,6-dideoxy-N-acetyl-beta-L-altrosamine N-acetyltransferase [Paraburkholderia kirstenboschensis]WOD18682.1 UDP-4-amino-4,6-dideoxy-N-acetyl-beta-L-altrosamine N-acetyltransferase [Paraburkholderia kirstenboschensis]